MTNRFCLTLGIAAMAAVCVSAQTPAPAKSASKQPPKSVASSHPDLSGLWLYSIDLPPTALKVEANGKATVKTIDSSGRRPAAAVSGALPFTPEPSYKPELRAKV